MEDFEKLGAFYLGRPYDLSNKTPEEGVLLYDITVTLLALAWVPHRQDGS